MTTLTQCQQQVLDMLISYQKERGFPPTNQEVATMLGYRSVNAAYSAAIFLIPICISFDTAEKRRYATYLILNRRFSFEF